MSSLLTAHQHKTVGQTTWKLVSNCSYSRLYQLFLLLFETLLRHAIYKVSGWKFHACNGMHKGKDDLAAVSTLSLPGTFK